ncbi:PREDICTED: serine/arginine repetitive matrix protein 1-like [Hipposideros armiger]|uniref:Serine/arginine repetitive matrix protein 1-like n=1 Tax=Hipposideros armiger TaxID=186990 RepID=A0A8B7QUP2_HIPAR|nr:PREDICTED: serine/arginine repetitive matrix protein 1-like [Hipposideros armiger]
MGFTPDLRLSTVPILAPLNSHVTLHKFGREGAGGERSSRVTSPTRRCGHRRRRRHFNRAFGLRSAVSVQAKKRTRSASRSHSSASRPLFASRPPTSPSAHTPHSPHPAAASSPPSLSSSARPPRPRSTPSARSPTPPSPDLCQRPEGKREASAAAGGVRVAAERPWSQEGKPQEILVTDLKPIMGGRPNGAMVKSWLGMPEGPGLDPTYQGQ